MRGTGGTAVQGTGKEETGETAGVRKKAREEAAAQGAGEGGGEGAGQAKREPRGEGKKASVLGSKSAGPGSVPQRPRACSTAKEPQVVSDWQELFFEEAFNVGLVLGHSASGKTSVLRHFFGEPDVPKWDQKVAIVSQFADPATGEFDSKGAADEAQDRLSSVGLGRYEPP